jgi:folate-binding protein YgfZ
LRCFLRSLTLPARLFDFEGELVAEQTPLHQLTTAASAVFIEEAGYSVPAHFGDPASEYRAACESAALFDVSHRGKIELAGPEAQKFLHNVSTNDIARLTVGAGCEALLSNAKAKVLARFLVYRVAAEDLWLDLDPGLAPATLKNLDRYLISEQLELSDRTSEYAQLAVVGPKAAETLVKAASAVIEVEKGMHCAVITFPTGVSSQLRRHDSFALPAFDLLVPAAHAEAAWRALVAAGARPAGMQTYHALRIEAGVPLYGQDIDENNLAMEIGRTPQAISYAKGCFPGQEPIVRARDLGHVNWSFRGLKLSGSEPVARGTKLVRDGKEIGHVTSSIQSPRLGGVIALGYVRRGNDEPGTGVEVAVGAERRKAEVSSLPFLS